MKSHIIILLLFAFLSINGCIAKRNLMKGMQSQNEFTGWYLGSSNAQFFVIEREGLFKRNIAISIPNVHPKCNSLARNLDVLNSDCFDPVKPAYFRFDNDTTTFNQDISILRAKAVLRLPKHKEGDFWGRDKIMIEGTIKAYNGKDKVRAVLIGNLAEYEYLKIYSNCSKDSVVIPDCE